MRCEIGTAENCRIFARVRDVIHLAVKQPGAFDRTNFYLRRNPRRAFARNPFLRQLVRQRDAVVRNVERFLGGLGRVERTQKTRFAKEEPQALNGVELRL
ncbi:MAG: hypothetical protein HDKAJFGB_00915 [Anaerolineae bacterium]|nr:hypothetical protein [Anaerolineae bacterium]